MEYLHAAILGLVEGLTEFLPVSSTGHLIVARKLLGFTGSDTFEVVIQLGAILAVCVVYFQRLWRVVAGLPGDHNARRFTIALLLAFLPAAVVGALAHDFIKKALFSPWVVANALILGGFAIVWIERRRLQPRYDRIEQFPAPLSLKVGVAQCLAMVPGVSRSGATILGALLMGVERRTAAEFSFFLAIPTMLGATVLDLYKSWGQLHGGDAALIGVGFVTAFVSAIVVVRGLIAFVGRHGFTPFAWYRIVAGVGVLAFLALGPTA
jgi:undecaprenyl-diphosphatase